MTVPFHHHHIGQFNAAKFRNPPNIVASQVHQHDMFSPLFWIRKQLFFQSTIFSVGTTTTPSSCQRPHGHYIIDHSTHDLRRASNKSRVRCPKKKHERARVYRPQCAINLEGVAGNLQLQTLTDHYLKNIARFNVVYTSQHSLLEGRLRKITGELQRILGSISHVLTGQLIIRISKLLNHYINSGTRFIKRLPWLHLIGWLCERDHTHRFGNIIKHDHAIKKSEEQVG